MKNLVQSKGNYGGGMTFLPLRRMKPVCLGFILLLLCNALLGYSLYVNAAADPNLADGTSIHPYVQIQDAIDHAFEDTQFHNYNNLHQGVTVYVSDFAMGYIENLVVHYPRIWASTYPFELNIRSLSNNPESCVLVTSNSSLPAILIDGGDNTSFSIKGLQVKNAQHNTNLSKGIVITSPHLNGAFQNLHVDNCIFEIGWRAIESDAAVYRLSEIRVSNSIFYLYYNGNSECSGIRVDGFSGHAGSGVAIITNNTFNTITQDSLDPVQALHISHNCSEVLISDNLFVKSEIRFSDSDYQETFIINNEFDNSWIVCDNTGSLSISNNTFHGHSECSSNAAIKLRGIDGDAGALICTITRNIFCDSRLPLDIICNNISQELVKSVYLYNNSFLGQTQILHLQRRNDLSISSNRVMDYRSNFCNATNGELFSVTGENNQTINLPDDDLIPISHSHFQYLSQNQSLLIDQSSVSYGDPNIVLDNSNQTYSLLWDSISKSPLINAGCPEIDGIPHSDPDGTPPDIGAIYYPHYQKEYFEGVSPSNIYWLSFPVVDDRTNTEGTYWNELGYMFESHMQNAPNSQLNQTGWSYDGLNQNMAYNYQNATWNHSITRSSQPIGYKVKFTPNIHPDPVIVSGFKAEANTTPVAWEVSVNQNGATQPFENWIGYFLPSSHRAGDAFSRNLPNSNNETYLDYIYCIKTREWSTYRISEEAGSRWIINPNTYTFSEGDMVSLLLLRGAPEEMYWNTSLPSISPIVKPRATAFSYEEKLDYTPVYLEFDPLDLPAEVGLYVDGECKGASVVDSCVVDVPLYKDEAKDSGELQIMCYYEGKGKKAVSGWKVYDAESMVFVDTTLRVEQIDKYAYLSLKHQEGDSPVPLTTDLQPNYPNPFNPDTNISFVLSKAMPIRMDIYNVRGQKVRTLCNAEFATGKHTIAWNGKDEQNRIVTSGIYFSRLTTPEGSFSQKMMFMK